MRSRRRLLIVGSIGVVVVGGALGGRALADSSSQVSSFRTATVKRTAVTQSEQRSGVIEPVAQGTVAFPIAGKVTSVAVQPGQTVTAGQTLATLDTTALQAAVTAQQANLAAAQLTLANALNGQSSSSTSSAARTTVTTTAAPQTSSRSSASSPSSSTSGARQAVASGQQDVDNALSTARASLSAASSSCGNTSASNGTFTQAGGSSSSTTSTTAQSSSSSSQQCVSDLQSSLDAQQKVASAQSNLAKAEATLDSMLSSASTSTQQAAAQSSPQALTPSTTPASSAELVADQAAVDAAQADVTAAQQNLAQGTIVSPIDGTVAAVNMKAGDAVSAGSSTENIIVVGPGGYEVTTTVPVTEIGNVKLSDPATVAPDGSTSALDGKVVSIGVMPTTSGSTTVYPVVIGLTGTPSGLRNGAAASVTITLNHVADALAVPTSAIRTAGGGAVHTVTVVSGGKTSTVPVQVGATGPDLTEIKSGLQEGQQVMLADLSQPLPSNTTNRGFGGGGGLGGGGAGGLGGATIGRGG
jgi:HlyD family secretion protein